MMGRQKNGGKRPWGKGKDARDSAGVGKMVIRNPVVTMDHAADWQTDNLARPSSCADQSEV